MSTQKTNNSKITVSQNQIKCSSKWTNEQSKLHAVSFVMAVNSIPYISGGEGHRRFDMSRHVSKQIAIAQKLYTRGGQKQLFSESSLSAVSKKKN